MLGPLGHVASYLAYVARRHDREAADAEAAAELSWAPGVGGVEVQWLGAAGFALRAEGTTVLSTPT